MAMLTAGLTLSYAPTMMQPSVVSARAKMMSAVSMAASFDQEAFISESKEMRLKYLEEQAMFALKTSCENFENAVFPNALIARDYVSSNFKLEVTLRTDF